MRKIRIALVTLALVAAACSSSERPSATSTNHPAPAESTSPTPTEAAELSSFPAFSREELIAMSEPVRVRAAEGVRIAGRLFGSGDVVLSHMGTGDQSQWLEFAGQLAEEGYLAMTYNRRGSCPGGELGCSTGTDDGDGWRDLTFLVEEARAVGAQRVVVGGASLGAMESLYALSHGLDADGLVWVAGIDLYNGVPVSEQVADVRVPKLLMSGDADEEPADLLEVFEADAPPPLEIVRLDTGEHGTDILAYAPVAVADEFREAVVEFLETI